MRNNFEHIDKFDKIIKESKDKESLLLMLKFLYNDIEMNPPKINYDNYNYNKKESEIYSFGFLRAICVIKNLIYLRGLRAGMDFKKKINNNKANDSLLEERMKELCDNLYLILFKKHE